MNTVIKENNNKYINKNNNDNNNVISLKYFISLQYNIQYNV